MPLDPEIESRVQKLAEKYATTGQDLAGYLDGLIHSDYLTYWDYIHLDTLLSLQSPRTSFPDESVFVMYHQITELYFKLCLHELAQMVENSSDVDFLKARLSRVTRYFGALTHSFSVMVEGMEVEQFLKFRMSLLPASGFQSAQYREIELYATDVERLVHLDFRDTAHSWNSVEECFDKIYWKSGATELATGKKTYTLQQFENKYAKDLLAKAKMLEGKNLAAIYRSLSKEQQQDNELRELFRKFDYQVNVDWPLAHYKSAARYLRKKPTDIQATGGTNWQKYLPPRFQRRIFYPELWSQEELATWGENFKYGQPQ